jgi:hypothetical protein
MEEALQVLFLSGDKNEPASDCSPQLRALTALVGAIHELPLRPSGNRRAFVMRLCTLPASRLRPCRIPPLRTMPARRIITISHEPIRC